MTQFPRVMIPRSHHREAPPLPIFDTSPDLSRNRLELSEIRQALPFRTAMFKGPPGTCQACGAPLEVGATIFTPEDSDWAPWNFCYSCGAGILMYFGWLTLADVVLIPYYGGGPGYLPDADSPS